MAEKKSWRDYTKDKASEDSSTSEKTGSWRDYSSSTSTTSGKSGGWRDYSTVDTQSIVGNNIINRVNSWLNSYNSLTSDYQKRYSGRKGNYEDSYVSDSGNWLDTVKSKKSSLDTEAEEILSYLEQYEDYLDKDWVSQIKSTLQGAKSTQSKILNNSIKDKMYWDSFNSEENVKTYGSAEEAYKANQLLNANTGKTTVELDEVISGLEDGKTKELLTSYRSSVELDEMGKYDLVAGAKEIEELERVADEIATISNQYFFATTSSIYSEQEASEIISRYNALVSKYGSPEEFHANLNKKKEYLEKAKYIQELNTWSSVTGNADFAQKSQYVSNVEYAPLGKPSFTDDTYAYVNNPTVEDKRILGAGTATARELVKAEDAIYKSDTPIRNLDPSYVQDALDYIKEDEVKIYNYYYATEGKEKADEYLYLLINTFKERKYAEAFEKAYKAGNEHPFWSSIASVATSIGSASEYLGDVVQYGADKIAGKDAKLDKNELAMTTNAIRGGVADTVDWKIGNWDAFDFLYNTTMSGIDSITSTAFGGAGGVVLGLSAAAQATNDAIDRGMSNGQAFWNGLFSGVFEGLFESVSIGNFNRLKEIAPNGIKDIIKNLGKSMLVNASEETLTEIANIAYDTLVNGEFANYTMEELRNGAWKQALGQVIEAGASGALMGVGMSAVGSTIGNTNANKKAKAEYGGKTDTLINQGLQNDVDSKSYQLATKYQQKVESKDGKKGKALTGQQIRNLLAANQDAITDKDMKKIQQAAENRLTELGQTGDVAKVAELAAKYATGHELTRAEKKILANSEYGSRVASELLPENVFTDLESSEWARNIGTKSVNALAYNIKSIVEQMAKMDKPATYKSLEERVGEEEKFNVSETGNATIHGTDTAIDLSKPEIVEFIKDKETGKVTDMVLNVDGKKVKASEIDFADGDQSYLYSAVKHIENITPGDATAFVRGYDSGSGLSVGEYLNGIDEAYTYGYHNYSEADMGAGQFAPKISDEKAKGAYELGKITKSKSDTSKSEAIKRMRTAVEAEVEKAKAENRETPKAKEMTITYRDKSGKLASIKEVGIRPGLQSGGIQVAEVLHKLGLGTNFEFFTSYESNSLKDKKGNPARVYINENGVETVAPAGVYRMSDGTIRVDLNAYNGRQLTLNALAHELTHFIQQWSDEKYKVLADFLTKTYGETGMTMHKRVIREQARLEEIRGEAVSYNEAYDEVVANAMMKMFDDGKLVERLTELKATDEKLAKKLWEGFKRILSKILGLYQNESALFHDTNDLMQMKDAFEQLQNMFAEALVEASENFQASLTVAESQTLTEAGIGFDENTKSVYSLNFSTAYKDEIQVGKKTFNTEAIAQVVAKGTGRSIEDARKWVQSELTIANIVMQNPEFLDFEADNRYDAIKKNSDYPQGTVDLSNLCPKREEFTAMFDMLQKKYPNKLFTAQDVAEMRKILSDNDITVACGACFVEDRRQLIGEIADTYINMWKEAVESGKPLQKTNAAGQKVDLLVTKALAKQYGLTAGTKIMATDNYIPNQYDLTTYEGFKKLEKNHPTIAMGFNRYNNSRGQQSARLIEGRAEYNRQILGWSDAKVRSVNNNGGLRIFSFSDFEVVHLLDLVQVIIDCSARGVKIQGYTKIPAFAKLVRNTGAKLNRSIIPKGDYGFHMENGKVVLDYDTTEGIDINDKNFVDESDNPNVGNVIIGINPTQIGAAMLEPFIDYIIPFHSNKAKDILRKLGTGEWVNYKESQHEKDISTGKASKHNVNIYTEVINKYHPTNKVEFVEAFLKECKRQGKIPRYAEFLNVDANGDYAYREGYHKLLVDFKMFDKDGNILPQGNIEPNLDESFMKELLNAEIDKKQNYEFPQEVYDAIDKKFGEQYSSQETDADSYDYTKSFADQVDDWMNGKFPDIDTLLVGRTPEVLRSIGVPSLPVTIAQRNLKDNILGQYRGTPDEIADHLITPEEMKKLPEKIADPVAIIVDRRQVRGKWVIQESTIDILVEMEINGKQVLVPIRLNGNARQNGTLIDANVVTSVHGNKDTVDRLDYALKNDSDENVMVFYVNKKKTTAVLRKAGYTITGVPNISDGFNHSIYDSGSPVKLRINSQTETRQFRSWFKGSKVVDKEGQPLIVYHGTPYMFTAFDTSKGRYGIYLTANKQLASSYGGNIMESYASIKKPKYIDAGNALANTMDMSKIAREAEAEGYDGLIITNLIHAGNANYEEALKIVAPEAMKEKESAKNAIMQINKATGYLDKIYDITDSVYSIPNMPLYTEPNLLWWAQKESDLMYDNKVSKQLAKLEPIQKEIASYVEQYNRAVEAIRKAENENANSIADTVYVAFESGQVKDAHKNIGTFDRNNPDTLYSSQETDADNAPTFYSQMGKVVEGMKQDKFGASSVISMLRGRGVKAEEIRWSGIHAFLDGKKSVTKQELLDFINSSMLQIEEERRSKNDTRTEFVQAWRNFIDQDLDESEILAGLDNLDEMESYLESLVEDEDLDRYYADYIIDLANKVDNKDLPAKWDQYKLDGGENYRELVFKMPGSDYSNTAMQTHWGVDAQGVLAHARIQDFNTFIGKMLFIEEIQSDWHNEGHKEGYRQEGAKTDQMLRRESQKAYEEFYAAVEKMVYDNASWEDDNAVYYAHPVAVAEMFEGNESYFDQYGFTDEQRQTIRSMVADEVARQSAIKTAPKDAAVPDAPFKKNYHEYVLKKLLRMAAEEGYDSIGWTTAETQDDRWQNNLPHKEGTGKSGFLKGYQIEYDQNIKNFLSDFGEQWDSTVGKTTLDNGTEVWSMAITDAMKKSVLKEGQAMYSTQETDNISNRDLLANAFESISKSSIEYEMIQDYKGMVSTLNKLDNELADINDEIRKIRFGTEGARDMEALRKLEEKANRIARDINKYDKRLLNMEASEPLRKVIERERKKEAQKTKDHIKEIQQNKKARAEQTELRHKIRKTVRDLDKILNRGNKKQNVKEDMQSFVSKALELADYLFTDHVSNDDLIRKGITVRMTAREEALVKETQDILTKLYDNADSLTDEEFARLDAKRKANENKLRDLLTSQRNERLNTPVYNLFNDLVTEYAALKNSNQEAVKGAYDPKVEEFLRSYLGENTDGTDSDRKTLLQNMRVADMTTEELWKLYNAYTMVLHSVRTANKLFVNGKLESLDKTVETIVSDFGKRKIPEGKVAIALRNLSNKFGWNYEKLYYALDRIGSEAFTELIMNLANSENTVMQDIIEAAAYRDEIVKNHGFNNWDVNKKIDKEFLDNTGKKFELTLGQLMSLYAYSRREGAWDHIEYGGFVFGEKALTDPRPADSYKLSKEQCEAITNTLTKEQKSYVEDMQKFLSETMGAKGNEVSMLLYGIKMFGEKNYFPIHVAGQYKAQANESQAKAAAGFGTMSNAGFTHAQNPNAKAPFVLEGFNEVWSDHVNEMSRYHGTVPALEDLRRVMNRSSYSDAYAESMSVKAMMENAFGQDAVDYFDNLYREANSGAIQDKLQRVPKKLLSLFRKNSVAYSLSVVIQQPSAMARAYAMIDKKYFGFKGFGALTSGIAKAVSSKWNPAYANAYNEMLKYAPGVTMAKEIGGFDTHTGTSIREYLLDTGKSFKQSMKTENVLGKGKAVMELVDDNPVANLPNVADKIAWIEIWNACKRETVAKHKDLATSSEEFMNIVGERFTEVIRATQVYDSMFSKSPMLKSKSLAVQYLVSFMNEPNTTANMIEKAVRDATKGDWKGGLRTAAAVTYSIIFNNVLKAMVYAMRDDDEDETYIEKYLAAVAGGMMDDFNPLNYIPVVRDAWSKARGYDVERPDVAIIADAIEAVQAIAKVKGKDTEGMTDAEIAELDKKMTEANWKLVGSIAAFFGIPAKNIYREIEGVIDHARIASKNAGMTTADSLWDKVSEEVLGSIPFISSKKAKAEKLYDAIISGDTKYLERMKGTYKTEDAYQNAVRKALRENDPRIHEAAQARYDGNTEEYKRIFREIKNEGKFTFDDIMSVINSEESAIKKGVDPEKATSDYTANGYVEAIAMGNVTEAQAMKDDIIDTKVANGKTQEEAEKEFASAVATGIGEAYSSGLLDKAGAEKMLVEYADKDEEEAASKVSYWSFLDAHPEYDQYKLSEANVNDYQEFAEPAEIPMEVYVQFRDGTKGLESIKDEWGDVEVTKREQVLEVIDSLPLTWQQKDALYLAAGYSEDKIWDVPW